MSSSVFGSLPDGRQVRALALGTPPGPVLHVLDLGATVHRLEVTGGDGLRRDVVLGLPTPADYLASTDHVGGTVGRYANRIAGGRFPLDGRVVELATNDRGHTLHGGPDGFDRRLWEVVEQGVGHAVLRLVSPDGDQGFPGELTATARFEVADERVALTLEAVTDASTVVNLTNHAYFDLDGDRAGSVEDQRLHVAAGDYTPVDDTGIPVSGPTPVAGTPFDFREARPVGAARVDHNLVLDGAGLRTAATLESRRTGIRLELRTDQPGLQVYTGSTIGGVALEPQLFPDSPNRPGAPSAELHPGELYRARIEWVLGSGDAAAKLGG